MTTWWWVRHGPTHRKDLIGWTDAPADLSDTAALSRLRTFLPDAPVVSSDLIRAVETANAIQHDRPRLPHSPALRELHFGAWEERRFDEPDGAESRKLRAFWEQPGALKAPGGESWDDIVTRVNGFVDAYAGTRDVIAVAHMGAILTQVQRALGLSAYDAFAHRIDPLSATVLSRKGDDWHVRHINHVP